MHFAWHAQYKRHLHQRCWEVRALISSDGLHFGASDLHFAKMILRHRCGTSYDLASVFRGRYSTLDRWNGKKTQNALVRGRQLCAQLSIFQGRLAELLHF